jgi:hypothetical protein
MEVIDRVIHHAKLQLIALPMDGTLKGEAAAATAAVKFLINLTVVPEDQGFALIHRILLARAISSYMINTRHCLIKENNVPIEVLEVAAGYPVNYEKDPNVPAMVRRVEKKCSARSA